MDLGWTLIVAIGAAQSLFLALLLAVRREASSRWLAGVLAVLAIVLMEEAVDLALLSSRLPWLVGSSAASELLLGPLLLAYARSLQPDDTGLRPVQGLWFLPFALAQLSLIPFLRLPVAEKLACLRSGDCLALAWVLAVKGLVLFGFLVAAWRAVPRRSGRLVARLVRRGLVAVAGLGVGTFLLHQARKIGVELAIDSDRLAGLGLTLLVHAFAFVVLWPRARGRGPGSTARYETSSLGAGRRRVLARRLLEHLQRDRPWLDPQLSLSELALELGVSVHHLSQTINEDLGTKFYELLARFRVEEAQRLILDPELAHRTVLDLGHQAGFNSKASFYRTFRRLTGSTPSELRQTVGTPESLPME